MLIDTSNLRSHSSHDWAYGPDVKQTYTGTEACPGIPTFVKASCGSTGICAPGREVKDSQRKFEFFVPHLVLLANYHFLRLFIMRIPDHFCSLVLTWQDAHWCMAWDQFCGLHWPGRQEQSLHVCERFREQFIWRRAHHFSKCQSCEACYAQLHSLQCPSSLVLVLKVDS